MTRFFRICHQYGCGTLDKTLGRCNRSPFLAKVLIADHSAMISPGPDGPPSGFQRIRRRGFSRRWAGMLNDCESLLCLRRTLDACDLHWVLGGVVLGRCRKKQRAVFGRQDSDRPIPASRFCLVSPAIS